MKSRFARFLIRSATLLPWLFTLTFVSYLLLGGGLQDLVSGRMHRIANTAIMGPSFRAGDIDEVRLCLLDGAAAQKTTQRFHIASEDLDLSVYGEFSLQGAKLSEFLQIWADQEPCYGKGAMCHMPVYGLRFYTHGKLRMEIALCRQCSNFSFSVFPLGGIIYGFDAHSKEGMDLLAFCNQLLPYPRTDASSPEAEPADWTAEKQIPIAEAAFAFNAHTHQRLRHEQVAPLIADEILAALALGASTNSSGKDLCQTAFEKGAVPKGARLTLVTDALIGPAAAQNDYRVSYITLTLPAPTPSDPQAHAPSSMQATTFPVRLIQREYKPWLRAE